MLPLRVSIWPYGSKIIRKPALDTYVCAPGPVLPIGPIGPYAPNGGQSTKPLIRHTRNSTYTPLLAHIGGWYYEKLSNKTSLMD